ncbi:leucyl aminopeptidase [Nakamurella antarctica]|uniref:Probable cytosol aminopeptidase n=1 Tax=Nakamurella antarctica TaxID=1902245 RepID=A0A3G8ZLQ8_9ACTN|nr:leucyl aminopeptidase [Nakamurella antarctica]AZI58272.1 leucyl aminopeptidase [Nakamurella antarctica]
MSSAALSAANPVTAAVEALVIGLYASDDGPIAADPALGDLAELLAVAGATGRPGETTVIPAPAHYKALRIVGAGLGPQSDLTPERIRKAAGAASRALAGNRSVGSLLSRLNIGAAAEGHLLGAYVFDAYKEPKKQPVEKFVLFTEANSAANKSILRRAVIGAEAVGLARDLVNTAPNDLPPAVFAQRANAAATEAGLKVEILDEKALAKGGYGGILGVGAGSSRPPRLVRITYTPTRSKATVALIGKGITFDSGGLSIKPAAGMDHMTSDMSGAAAVVATVIAAAALKLPITITATAPLAENLPSGSSYRPGDVLTHFGGKTVHVLNTDAEGRLVLADAIVRAVQDKPDFLIETSTLTGAQVVALGNRTMGVMGTEAFRDRIALLAREVGEGGWAMPMPEELREGLDSAIADIANVAGDRAGGMLVAAHYLKEFVPEGLTWAHLDVAGPAFNTSKPYGYTGQGGTGIPVRTLLAVLEDIAGA